MLGLSIALILAVRWLLEAPGGPVTIAVALYGVLAVLLSALPGYMNEAFGFGRPVSPLLLWIMIEAVSRKKWIALAPPLLVSLSVSLVFASPLVAIVKGLMGH